MSTLKVIYEDNHIVAVNKPAGALVQGDKTGDETLADEVKEYIKRKYKKPGDVFLGIVHRIDRPVSGIVVFARTSKALVRMNKMFQDKEIQKTYWAVVEKAPPIEEDTIVSYLKKNQEKNRSRAYDKEVKGSKKAILEYELKGSSNNYYYMNLNPITGRHHQIRIQLSHIGCCIKGDLKYGGRRSNKDGSIHLHARSISFQHPVKDEMMNLTAKPNLDDPLWTEMYNLCR
ncbi:MAG: 23S rRNA pseudouridine1911/1915/1917 synthase [Parvicella sp.]|jgi:23S rRNA pseudouridine1911/1915/1917 synthase